MRDAQRGETDGAAHIALARACVRAHMIEAILQSLSPFLFLRARPWALPLSPPVDVEAAGR